MRSYQETFAGLQRAALIPFFVLGDPDEARALELIGTACEHGADVLELGIPFSDPIADGPTIQKADIRALQAGVTCEKALALIGRVRDVTDAPVGLLMYYNLIMHYGVERFYADAAAVGVNSVLVADLSIDDAEEVSGAARANGLDTVFMVTPNTPPERRAAIARRCTGFVYTVSLMGVTGARERLSTAVEPLVRALKQETEVPVCVGFGVSRPEHARQLARVGADGVIVGSAIVRLIEENLDDHAGACRKLADFLGGMRAALEAEASGR